MGFFDELAHGFRELTGGVSTGDPMHTLTLVDRYRYATPHSGGVPVPVSAPLLVHPGSKLHAKPGAGPKNNVVNWTAGEITEISVCGQIRA